MRVAAAILLVASGCALVMSRPSEEIKQDEPVGADGPALSSVIHIGRNINGVWHEITNKVHQIEENVFKPLVHGVHESADGAVHIFIDTANAIHTDVIKPAVDAVHNGVAGALEGVSNTVNDIKVYVVKPFVDGVHEGTNGAIYIIQDAAHGITTGFVKPTIDVVYNSVSGTLHTIEHTINATSSAIQNGINAVHVGAINALENFDHKVDNINSGAAAHTADAVEETANDN